MIYKEKSLEIHHLAFLIVCVTATFESTFKIMICGF